MLEVDWRECMRCLPRTVNTYSDIPYSKEHAPIFHESSSYSYSQSLPTCSRITIYHMDRAMEFMRCVPLKSIFPAGIIYADDQPLT
jgi:hypothetical protein